MSENTTAEVTRLVAEARALDRVGDADRRSETRSSFVFPVLIHTAAGTVQCCFSKDLSPSGIGLIQAKPGPIGTIARLVIACTGPPFSVQAQLVWQRKYALDWHLSGWKFLEATAPEGLTVPRVGSLAH